MRAFVAVELPAETHRSLVAGLAEARRTLPSARWVRPEGIHITLKFLGEQPDALVRDLGARAAESLARLAPVEVRFGGGGFFPSPRRPRVAWLGGEAVGLERWAAAVEDCAAAAGIAREVRPFSLHVTLARIERPWRPEEAESFLSRVAGWRLPPFLAREAVLFSSVLGPGGARYTPVVRVPVAG
ncbi:MAG: RNA 2',3'-cyclic phosphodiesterase [Acidobacteriota bacterium]